MALIDQPVRRRYRLACVASHVIQYHVPLYRTLAQRPEIDLMVYFCLPWGAEEYLDREFGARVRWDTPLLDGYAHRFLRNVTLLSGSHHFLGALNPGLVSTLIRARHDGVIVPGYALASYWLAYLGAWLSKTPVFFRGESALREGRGLKQLAKRTTLRLLFRHTAAFLSIGSRSADFYRSYGVSDSRMFFTPYTVDNEHFSRAAPRSGDDRARAKRELGLATDRPAILFAGKLIERKRPLDLLKAVAGLRAPASLVFVGDGELRPGLEAAAREQKLAGVTFAGFQNQSQMPRYYAAADLLVLPSSHEVSPLVLNEAMCAALALAVSEAVPSAVDLVREGVNGKIFPCGDVLALTRVLEGLVSDPLRLAAMGRESAHMISGWNNGRAADAVVEALSAFARPPVSAL